MESVLIIMNHLRGGGAETMLASTLRLLEGQPWKITLLSADKAGAEALSRVLPWLDVRCFRDIYHSFALRRLFYAFPFLRRPIMALNWRRASRVLGQGRYDVALSYLEGHSAQLHQGLLPCARRHVSWVHTDFGKNHWSGRYFISEAAEKAFYRAMDTTVFVSEGTKNSFLGFLPLRGDVRVVHNYFDREALLQKAQDSLSLAPKRCTLVAVGRLVEAKRFDRLLRVLARMKEEGVPCDLWLLGDGKKRPELERLARSLGLREQVQFLGYQLNPYPYMKAAHFLISTSDTEGYPMVLGEALCLGLPVVATAEGGVPELLEGAGILVPPDEAALCEACLRVASDPSLRERLSASALEASSRFRKEEYLRQFCAALTGEKG